MTNIEKVKTIIGFLCSEHFYNFLTSISTKDPEEMISELTASLADYLDLNEEEYTELAMYALESGIADY